MPAQRTSVRVLAPIGGESKRFGFQSQDSQPFTTYESINVWPLDVVTGRAVSASRPALVSFSTPTNLVNLLAPINGVASGKPLQSFVASENGTLKWWNGTGFTNATGSGATSQETAFNLYAWPFLQKVYIPRADNKPWVFNYVTGAVDPLAETAGTIPNDLRMFVVWQGALWGSGRLAAPNILYGSRVGDATDWDFSAPITDTGGAFFTGGENEGLLNGPVTALVPHTKDTMLVSTTEGFRALRGHPRVTQYTSQHDAPYILGQGAWCKSPDDTLYYMSREGLIQVAPGDAINFINISRGKLPVELMGLPYTYADPDISLEYDSLWNGIHITKRGQREQAWWYDLTAGGFHRMTFESYPRVLMDFAQIQTENESSVLYGGVGIKRMDRFGGETFTSKLAVGPFPLSADVTKKSKIQRTKFVFGSGSLSGDGTVRVIAGADAEDVVEKYEAASSGSEYSVGFRKLQLMNAVCHPKVGGTAGMIDFEVTKGRLVFEEAVCNLLRAGLNRIVRFTSHTIECDGYATATPQTVPATELTDAMEMVNLAALPSEWWALANATGSNIRVSDQNNRFLPFDLIGYQKDEEAGAISLRRTLPTTAAPVRIWCCDQNLAAFPPGSEYGQFFAYPPWVIGWWPSGIGRDRLDPTSATTPSVNSAFENPFWNPGSQPESELPEVCKNFGADPVIGVMGTVDVGSLSVTEGTAEVFPFFSIEACTAGSAGEGNSGNRALAFCLQFAVDTPGLGVEAITSVHGFSFNGSLTEDAMSQFTFEAFFPDSIFYCSLDLSTGLQYTLRSTSVGDQLANISGGIGILPQPSLAIRRGGLPSNVSEAAIEAELTKVGPGDTDVNFNVPTVRSFLIQNRSRSDEDIEADVAKFKFYQQQYAESDPAATNAAYWGSWTFQAGAGTLFG